MKLFRKAGCGCIYIEVGEGWSGTQIVVESCGGSDGSVSPFFAGPSSYIRMENLGGEFISEEEHRPEGPGCTRANENAEWDMEADEMVKWLDANQ